MKRIWMTGLGLCLAAGLLGCDATETPPHDDLPLTLPDAGNRDATTSQDAGPDAGATDVVPNPDATTQDDPGTPDGEVTPPDATTDDVVLPDVGANDPGPTDLGGSDPGTPDPGTIDPGTTDPGPPPCQLTEEQCFGPTMENGKTYGPTAAYPFFVSRQALSLRTQRWNPDNQNAGNNDDLPSSYCRDAGPDQFFRVYLMAGELLNIQLVSPLELNLNLKVYRGIQGNDPNALMGCKDDDVRFYHPGLKDDFDLETYPFEAPAEDWYTVVVDGATRDDLAKYLLEMTLLNCAGPDCCCP